LWALAIGIPQGEGFIGERGKHGMARIADIAVRPILLVGMFVLALGLYEISPNLLTVLASEALGADKAIPTAGMRMTLSGLIGGYLIYTILAWRTIHFSLEMLHNGPYWALRILGIDGEKGREGREMEGIKETGSNTLECEGDPFRIQDQPEIGDAEIRRGWVRSSCIRTKAEN
jgi:hypothetical protein